MGGAGLAVLEMPETLLLMLHPSAPPLNKGCWDDLLSTLLRFQLDLRRRGLNVERLLPDHYFEGAPTRAPRLPLPLTWSRLWWTRLLRSQPRSTRKTARAIGRWRMRCGTAQVVWSRLLEARADSNPPAGFSPLLMAVARCNTHLVTGATGACSPEA